MQKNYRGTNTLLDCNSEYVNNTLTKINNKRFGLKHVIQAKYIGTYKFSR